MSACAIASPPRYAVSGRPELQADFIAAIADASVLPMVVFQHPHTLAFHDGLDDLVDLCERVPSIVAIKDLGGDPRVHERMIETLHGLARPVNVLTTHSMWLTGSIAMGARGVISGAGSVIADRQVVLFHASTGAADEAARRRLTRQMSMLLEAFYGRPHVDWQARMKEVVARSGRIESNTVRGPLQAIGAEDWRRMETLFEAVGFGPETIYLATA